MAFGVCTNFLSSFSPSTGQKWTRNSHFVAGHQFPPATSPSTSAPQPSPAGCQGRLDLPRTERSLLTVRDDALNNLRRGLRHRFCDHALSAIPEGFQHVTTIDALWPNNLLSKQQSVFCKFRNVLLCLFQIPPVVQTTAGVVSIKVGIYPLTGQGQPPPPPAPKKRPPNSANLADLFCRFVGFLIFADLFCQFVGFL